MVALTGTSQLRRKRIGEFQDMNSDIEEGPEDSRQIGIKVHGYLHSSIGLGHAARSYVRAAQRCDRLNVSWNPISLKNRDQTNYQREFPSKSAEYDAELSVFGLDRVDRYHDLQAVDSFSILCPFWELSSIDQSIRTLHLHDSIWVASSFIETAVNQFLDERRAQARPHVLRMPLAIMDQPRNTYANNAGVFRILVSFDVNSWLSRKNPLQAIRAFQAAFPKAKDTELIVKINPLTRDFRALLRSFLPPMRQAYGRANSAFMSELKRLAARDSRLTIINRSLTQGEMDALFSSINTYLSLHRSEGFGLGLAEALARQIPVVGTDYGGTTDFLNHSTGFPVSYELKALNSGDYVQAEGKVWAEPSIEDAAAALRAIYDDFDGAVARAETGRRLIKSEFSYRALADRIDAALGTLL